jgi:hypothetical protein
MRLHPAIEKFCRELYWHNLVKPVDWLLSTAVFSFFSYLVSAFYATSKGELPAFTYESIIAYVEKHPIKILAPLAVAILLILIWRLIKRLRALYFDRALYKSHLTHIGLRDFLPHDNDERRGADWANCVSEIAETQPAQVSILGAGGYETFGAPSSPLHNFVRGYTGELRILLLDPRSPAFSKRCKNLGVNEGSYRDWIWKSIELCVDLKTNQGRRIEVKLYRDAPIWKMIFTPSYLWLQYYDTNRDVHTTPVYVLQASVDKYRAPLYYPLTAVFARRWDDESSTAIDLAQWSRAHPENGAEFRAAAVDPKIASSPPRQRAKVSQQGRRQKPGGKKSTS